jgi:hypothetical protein
MKFISTRVHGVIDYLMGIILIVGPWILGFADNTIATYLPVALGIAALLYSLCTDYELGAFKLLPMRAHLGIDFLSGLLLAASPWIFQFSDRVYMPHLVLGILEIGAALMTRSTAGRLNTVHDRQHAH